MAPGRGGFRLLMSNMMNSASPRNYYDLFNGIFWCSDLPSLDDCLFDDNASSVSSISNSAVNTTHRKRNTSASSSIVSEPYSADFSVLTSMRASQSMPALLTDRCRASNDSDVALALKRLGVEMLDTYYEQAEELCQNVLVLLYTLMWKGLDGSTKSWKVGRLLSHDQNLHHSIHKSHDMIYLFPLLQERGQVFAAVHYTHENYILLKSRIEIKRKLIEMMLQGCIMDLKESGTHFMGKVGVSNMNMRSVVIQFFYCGILFLILSVSFQDPATVYTQRTLVT